MRHALVGLLFAAVAPPLMAQTKIVDLRASVAWDGFGTALDTCGDLDGDGVPELAVALPWDSTNIQGAGRLVVLPGSGGPPLLETSGWQRDQTLGYAVATVGDVDLDGVPDLAVGLPNTQVGGLKQVGVVRLLSGATLAELNEVRGSLEHETFGMHVSATGDLDGDGVPDFSTASNTLCDPVGCLPELNQAYSGSTAAPLAGHVVGMSVRPAGDVDGDGRDDYLSWDEADGVGVRLRSGATGAVLDSLLAAPDEARILGGPAADMDGDGRPEYVFASYTWVPQVVTLSLRSLGKPPLLDVQYAVPYGAMFVVDARADLTGDGIADIVTGQPQLNFGTAVPYYGAVRVFSGADGTLVAQMDSQTAGADIEQMAGTLALAGDWNGDGLFDIAAGAWITGGPPAIGHVNIFSVPPEPSWTDLGHGLASAFGQPLLIGHGQLAPNSTVSLDLVSASPNTPSTTLVIGLSEVNRPFKGGLLVPAADALRSIPLQNPAGWFSLDVDLGPGVPPGNRMILQAWTEDATAPQGFSASNALAISTHG